MARRSFSWQTAPDPADFIITYGATEALHLALRAVTKPGDLVVLESPSYFGTLLTLQTLGVQALELPTDPQEGLRLDALESALERHSVAACVVSPTCQNPLGASMPEAARRHLIDLVRGHDVALIEDDVYGETYFGVNRPAPVKAYDRDGRVLLCSSFSKVLSPGCRVGWIAPGRYRKQVLELKLASTSGNPALPQLVVAAFLRGGSFEQHLRRLRSTFSELVDRMREAVATHFPQGTKISRPQGGFVLWVEMPTDVDAVRLARDAREHRIALCPGPLFSARGGYRNCLRLNCGQPWTNQVDAAVADVGRLARLQIIARRH